MKYYLYKFNKMVGEAVSHGDGTYSVIFFKNIRAATQTLSEADLTKKKLRKIVLEE